MFFLKKLFLISLSSIVFFISNNIFATTIIHAGKLIDGKVDAVQSKMTIVINDNLITDVIKGYKNPKDDEIYLDLKDLTVLPGLMDMHVHFGGEYQSKAERPSKVEKEMEAILATQDAYVTFKAGFTTVRQVGDSGMVAISLRDAINQGKVVGPRIYTSGKSLATTGGHADPTNGSAVFIHESSKIIIPILSAFDPLLGFNIQVRYQKVLNIVSLEHIHRAHF